MEDLHDSNEAARLIMQPQTDQVSTTLLRAHKEEGAFSTYVDISSTTNILHEENNGFRESVDDVDEKPGYEVHVKDDKATFNSLDPNEELSCVIIPACEESMQPMPTGCAGNTLVMESTCSGEVFSSLLSESEESGSPLTISSGLANDRVDSSTSSHDTVNGVQLPSTLVDTNIPVFEDQDFETNLDEYSQTTNDLINVPAKMEKGVVPNENGKAKVDQTFYAIMVPHVSDISSSDEANKRVTNLEHGFECPAQKEDEPCGLNSPQGAQTACGNFGMVHVCAHEGNSHSVTLAEESTSFEESNEQTLISLLTYNDVPDDLQTISLTRACSCKDSSSVVHKKEEFYNPVLNYPNPFLQGSEEEHIERPFDDDADQNAPVQHVTSGSDVMFNLNDQNTSFSVQVSKPNIYTIEAKSKINLYQELQVPSENGTTLCDCEELISPSNQAFTSPCLVHEKFTDKVDQEFTSLGPSFIFPMPPSPLPNNTVSSNPLADLNRPSEVQCVEHQGSSSPQGSCSPNEENIISLVHCDKDIPSDHQGLSCLVAVCEENTSPIPSGHHQSEMQTPLPDCKELTNLLVIPNSQSHQVPSTDEVLCSPCESVVHEGLNDSVSKDRNSDTCDHEDHTTLSGFQELSNLLASEEETIPLTTVIDNSVSQSLVNEELIIAVPVDRENGTSDGTMPDGEDSFDNHSDFSPCKESNSVVSSGHVLVGASLFPSAETLSSSPPLHEETANLTPANIIDDISHSPESYVSPSNISTPVNRLNTFQPTTESHFFLDCFKANKEGSKQLKSSSGDRDERIPSKVRIIERTDTEVHSSDQAVPDCEASSLTSQPKSDTEPFYQDTIRDCEASRPTYQPRSDTESFYQDAVLLRRNDVKPHNLSQNSVFSWDRVDIIHDTPVEKDSNSEGSLFKVLPLKTCMKPRRVGLSKRQKLPPLHHKVRKPPI
ncbi:uncharacterized protein LOC135470805 [Liolophura sinensis]|uniref:uncharacterized protein LOC135470805 n=1 Tax=Liolophura sinensis TaxID=3198878 RepID=UPI0031594AA2